MATKCDACAKSIYPNDPSWGAEGKKWHKQCFKCSVCSALLVLRNAQLVKGVIYCERDKPVDKPIPTAERMDIENVKNKPKVGTVNNEMRGELVGQKSQETTDSFNIGGRIQVGKIAQESRDVNTNIRGSKADQQTNLQQHF
eukprot:TRINITY_DN7622_c0_g1_i1.p1 TRINITY_DN7622_c0_g1~~TRINITY_DN7622_c0_g1_i1.p1  ORF type:complete len:142 (-),score=25.04 TRINITY_DN7622_c0_g1_i1:70-495(-)